MYADLTDANHNLENVHYKLIVGGNSMKVIGILVIDKGLLTKSDIDQYLWQVNYFALYLIVIQLASADSVSKIRAVEHYEQDSTLSPSHFYYCVEYICTQWTIKVCLNQRNELWWYGHH